MKIVLYYYVVSGGDGSAYPVFFTTKEKRDAYIKAEEEVFDEGFCEADGEVNVTVNIDGSFSINNGDPIHYSVET